MPSQPAPLAARLRRGPVVLDAAMGTELDRRGVPTTLPLWSAIGLLEHPDVVRTIHRDELLAGAEIVTTNTFRATARALARAGRDPAGAADLNRLAVRLAREAIADAGRPGALVGVGLEHGYARRRSDPRARAVASLVATTLSFVLVLVAHIIGSSR